MLDHLLFLCKYGGGFGVYRYDLVAKNLQIMANFAIRWFSDGWVMVQ
jgi:hypothetical protein